MSNPTQGPGLEGPWDLVVVGHGAAGLSAAASFLESHQGGSPRVAVLDRASVDKRGGSTAWTSAAFRLDDDQQLAPDWGEIVRATAGEHVNEGYIESFYENAVDTLNWIRNRGVGVVTMRNAAPPNTSWGHHFYAIQGGGRAFVDVFTELVQSKGAHCFYETEIVGLEREPGGPVTGVRVRTADGAEHVLRTSAVVLASGGYEGDKAEFGRRVKGGETIDTVSEGTRVNTGAGIAAAVQVGAAKAGQYDGAHLEPIDPRATDSTEPLVMTWMYGILVDPQGRRFIDETGKPLDLQFDYVARATLAHGGLAYAITDASVRAATPAMAGVNLTPLPSVKADSITELAHALGIDAEGLEKTVAEFNAAANSAPYDPSIIDDKATEGITPPKSYWAQPLTQAPFEAWPVGAQICFTFEGLRVDDTTHVLDTQGRRIDGLHAAGEIVGTFYQDSYPAGTSVLRSLTFGREAGKNVAAELAAARA
jgi:tricarballylate dehydrogenase